MSTCHENLSSWEWSSKDVTAAAFHSLAQQCLVIAGKNYTQNDFVSDLVAPNTFFVQLVRLSITLCIVTVLFFVYNSVRVLEQPIISTATCSLYWVVFFSFAALKSLLLLGLVPGSHSKSKFIFVEQGGFIAVTILQLAASYVLYLALHHESQFRSSEYATIDSPPRRSCIGLRSLKHMCSWHRLIVLAITAVPLFYLVAIEIAFTLKSDILPSAVVWVFILTLPLPRLAAMGMAIYLVVRPRSHLQPTILAKVFLFMATVLSIMEDIPNSVTTAATGHKKCTCLLSVLTVYDVLQLLGLLAFLFYVMFVRSQYLRVEQESKLNLVEGLQKLLEVNGRKDVIKRVYSS